MNTMITSHRKRIVSFFLTVMVMVGLAAPALSFTIAVITAESRFQEGELSFSGEGGWTVSVRYGEDAGIPDHAGIMASEVSDAAGYRTAAEEQLQNGQTAVLSRFFDIDIVDEAGESVALMAPVEVSIEIPDAPAESAEVSVFHFKEDAFPAASSEGGTVPVEETADPETPLLRGMLSLAKRNADQDVFAEIRLPDEEELFVLEASQSRESSPADEIVLMAEEEAEIEEVRVTDRTGGTVSFLADGFSVYGVVYTVDFHYENEIKSFDVSIRGGSFVTLSELAEELGIIRADEADAFPDGIEDVSFSDENLVKVVRIEEDMSADAVLQSVFDVSEEESAADISVRAGDWLLISLAPFRTEETLTVVMKNGETVVIRVTDEQTANLAAYVTDAALEIEGRTYGAGETWVVHEGAPYTLKLTFKEERSRQFPQGGEETVMDPADLGGMSLVAGQSGTFVIPMGLYGAVTGNQWRVDADGMLHIRFGEDPDNLLTRSNNAYIKIQFDVRFSGSEGQAAFNDVVRRAWEADAETGVSVTKTGRYNPSAGKMEYTVTVVSTGSTSNVTVTDVFATSRLLTLDQDSIAVTPEKELAEEGNSTAPGGFARIMKNMSHGEKVTITYTADVNEAALGPNGSVIGDDGKNNVLVRDDQGDEDGKTHVVHDIRFSDLEKVSLSQTETEDGKICLVWTVTANTARRASLVGSTVTDRIDPDSKDIMKYAAASDGKVRLHVTGTDAEGNTYSQITEVTPEDNGGRESWTWTVENIGEPAGTPLSYKISYETIAERQTGSAAVKNSAENSSGGSDVGVGVVPGKGDTLPAVVTEKAATSVTAEYVDWEIVVNVPEEGFPEGLTVIDSIPWAYGGEDETNNGFADRLAGAPTVTGLTGTETFRWRVEEDFSRNFTRGGERYAAETLTIEFYQDADSADPGLGGGPRTVTIRLRTENDPKWLEYALTCGTGDPIYTHTNHGKVNTADISAYAIPLVPSLEKELYGTADDGNGLPVYQYMITLANVTELPVVMEDTFNGEYLEFCRVGVDGWEPFDTIAAAEQKYRLNEGVAGYAAAMEETHPGTVTITAEDLPRKEDGSFYEYYRLYYSLKVKDAAALADLKSQALRNGGKYTLKNTAVWGNLPAECHVDYTVHVVGKEGCFASDSDEERKFTYVIDVNPDRYNLSGGDTVELTDQHTENLSVDYSSVKIYRIPEGASVPEAQYAAGNNLLHPEWLCERGSVPWNFSGNSGTFTLDDQTHYIIVYDAIVIGSGTQTFRNNADLEGFTAYKEETRTYRAAVSAGGEVWEIKLLKYKDGLTSRGLEGAAFQLFKGTGEYVRETDGISVRWTENKEPMKYGDTENTRARGLVGKDITFTTDADGLVTIRLDEVNDGNELEGGVHYYLKEIESPAGYQIDSSTEYWSFTLTTDPDEVNYGDDDRRDEYGNRQWIYFYYNDILKIANTETTNPLKVVVNKTWFDEEERQMNDEALAAAVQLMRKTDDGEYVPVTVGADNTVTEVTDGAVEQSFVFLTKDNNWSYTWNDLPRAAFAGDEVIHRYAYKVEEVELDGYVVSVSVTETETVKTYALSNYRIPGNKTTDLTVKKIWQNAEGQTLEGTDEKLPREIRFRLYRAVSTTPFSGIPTTGGSPYVISGDPHLVDAAASEGDALYGLYQLTGEENWTAAFYNLPETETDGNPYYYAYYVEECPLTGYSASYLFNGTERTIVNREPLDANNAYIDIELVKKWTNGTDDVPPHGAAATFTVRQQKAAAAVSEGNITVNLVDDNETLLASVKASDGDELLINGYDFADWNQDHISAEMTYKRKVSLYSDEIGWMRCGQLVKDWRGNVSEVTVRIDESSMAMENVVTLKVNAAADRFSSLPVLGSKSSSRSVTFSEYEDTGLTRTVSLPTAAGLWETTVKNLLMKDSDGNLYRYCISEDSCAPAAVSVAFRDQEGNDLVPGAPLADTVRKVEVTNTHETTDFTFTKIWRDSAGINRLSWPTGGEITVIVRQNNAEYARYRITDDDLTPGHEICAIRDDGTSCRRLIVSSAGEDGYVFVLFGLPAGNGGETYAYTVSEENAADGFQPPKYENQMNGIFHVGNGGTIYNDRAGAELPATGSSGTAFLYVLGAALIVLAGTGWVLNGRRRRDEAAAR